MKVVARITGGLGNQLFQYAMGRALAARHSARLLLDLSHYEAAGTHTHRGFELAAFKTRFDVATGADLAPFRPSLVKRVLARTGLASGPRVLHQRGFGFNPEALGVEPPIYLDGTWQSEQYFTMCSEALRTEVTLNSALSGEAAALANRLYSQCSISVHVRRGDYAHDPKTRDYHGLLSMAYYTGAIQWMLERLPEARFFVFSDEPQWAREHLRADAPVTVLPVRSGPEDLMLMAQCRHHIIANSSFSWWGAWLNPSDAKLVVAPRRWFADASIRTNDLLPATWTRL